MPNRSLAPRIAALEADGSRFAVATVVAVQRPTSAKPGARGIVHPDGTIEGWVGGSCAQPVVVREALRALVDGQPRLLRLSKSGAGATPIVAALAARGGAAGWRVTVFDPEADPDAFPGADRVLLETAIGPFE